MKSKLDLAFGNPGFLQELWEPHNFLKDHKSEDKMPYKYGKQSTPELAEVIKALHKKYNNALITDSTRIVITIGGSQAVQAALFAFKKHLNTTKVNIPIPYWSRFNDFASLNGMTITQDPKDFKLVTSPNNPDGADRSGERAEINDACYNWCHYTKNVVNFTSPVVLFSLAKLSGHASTRIGWAVVQDEQVAKYLQHFVNSITLGVSVEAQESALGVMKHILHNPEFLEEATKIIDDRYSLLNELIARKQLPIKSLSNQGMFWYVEADSKLIEDLNIDCSPGEEFHDPYPNRYRINIGCDSESFNEFVARLELI